MDSRKASSSSPFLKRTWLLLLLNILVFGFIFLLEMVPHRFTGAHERLVLAPGLVQASQFIELDSAEGYSWKIGPKGKGWFIYSPIVWPANKSAVSEITYALERMKWDAKFPISELRDNQSLADFGLQDPLIEIILHTKGQMTSVKVGQPSGIDPSRYLLSTDGKSILVLPEKELHKLLVPIHQLRSQQLFDEPLYAIRSLSIESRTGNKILLSQNRNQWVFELPIKTFADKEAVRSSLNQLLGLKAIEFVPRNISEQGLATPSHRIVLEMYNQTRRVLLIGSRAGQTSDAGLLEQNNRNYYYAQFEDRPEIVFTIPTEVVDLLREAQVTLRERRVLQFDPAALTTIDVESSENSISLQRLENGHWQALAKNASEEFRPQPADTKAVEVAINALANLEATSFVNDAPAASDIQNLIFDQLQAKITLTTNLGVQTLLIGEQDGTDYAKLEGSASLYTIDAPSLFQAVPAHLLHYRRRLLDEQPSSAELVSLNLTVNGREEPLLSIRLTEQTDNWQVALQPFPIAQRRHIERIVEHLKAFRVKSYIQDEYSAFGIPSGSEVIPWFYQLNATFRLPAIGEVFPYNAVEYHFTQALNADTQYGGSPQKELTFLLSPKFMESFALLVNAIGGKGGPQIN